MTSDIVGEGNKYASIVELSPRNIVLILDVALRRIDQKKPIHHYLSL